MFCHKCGTKIPDDAEYCYCYGTKIEKITTIKKWFCPVCDYVHEGDVPPEKCPQCGIPGSKFTEQDIKSQSLRPDSPDARKLLCPNCHSTDLIPITETRTDISGGGYGVGKGCCGWVLLGPFGLLCGLCGTGVKSHSKTVTSWVCKNCGNKFRSPSDIKAEESAEVMATCANILVGSIVLYIAGNLFAENNIRFFGIPNWLYITLGVLGMILGSIGVLGAAAGNMEEPGEPNVVARGTYLVALIVSVGSLVGGIIFAITGIRFFWAPAWVYIVLGLLGSPLSALMLLIAWGIGANEEEIAAWETKYGPIIQKIVSMFDKNK